MRKIKNNTTKTASEVKLPHQIYTLQGIRMRIKAPPTVQAGTGVQLPNKLCPQFWKCLEGYKLINITATKITQNLVLQAAGYWLLATGGFIAS